MNKMLNMYTMTANEIIDFLTNGVGKKGKVYCLRGTITNLNKIGAAQVVIHRTKTLQTGSAEPLKIVATIDVDINYRKAETLIQHTLGAYRVNQCGRGKSEWFNADEEEILKAFHYLANILGNSKAVNMYNSFADDLIIKKPRTSSTRLKTVISVKTHKEHIFDTLQEIADYFGCSITTVANARKYDTLFKGEYYICA